MTRYTYNRQIDPPAPFVHVTLRCPETGRSVDNHAALIDTAADRTVIPGRLVGLLALIPLEEIFVSILVSPRAQSSPVGPSQASPSP